MFIVIAENCIDFLVLTLCRGAAWRVTARQADMPQDSGMKVISGQLRPLEWLPFQLLSRLAQPSRPVS
jgi:hypothetical protein